MADILYNASLSHGRHLITSFLCNASLNHGRHLICVDGGRKKYPRKNFGIQFRKGVPVFGVPSVIIRNRFASQMDHFGVPSLWHCSPLCYSKF